MKYLRKFASEADYNAFKESDDYVTPNVVLVNGKVDYNPVIYPLYIEARESLNVSFSNTYEYSKDNKTWTSGTSYTSISANAGEKVFFRASGLTASSSYGIGRFTISNGNCNVGGNIMSMVYGADFDGKTEITQAYQFYTLFNSATKIVDASGLALPATTLANNCYQNMFSGCTSLVSVPALPATTLANNCYNQMFLGCTSLVNAPALPATTLANNCYDYMFRDCASLVNAPALPAKALAERCYYGMFSKCTSLVNAPVLPATTLASGCYQVMFAGCTLLVNAPALPATTLAGSCYYNMFNSCTSLVNAPALPATTLAESCYSSMFGSCTSLVKAPVLPATTLVQGCYNNMFKRCSNLNYIKAMFITSPGSSYMEYWVEGVSASGTFVKNSAATWANLFDRSGIPSGWTVELADA